MSQELNNPTNRRGDFTDVDREIDTILKARIEPHHLATTMMIHPLLLLLQLLCPKG